MADNKSGRDKKAHDERQQQDERNMLEQRERADETEPPIEREALGELEQKLEEMSYPATATEIRAAVGDLAVETADETYTAAQLFPETESETIPDPRTARVRIQRPTIAAAMTRIVETIDTLPDSKFPLTQRDAYEKSLRALKQIDADDDDEGVEEISDWIVSYIQSKQRLPGSRDVRRQGAKFCRKHGYAVRNDEWLGV